MWEGGREGGRADMHFGGRIWNKENGLESREV